MPRCGPGFESCWESRIGFQLRVFPQGVCFLLGDDVAYRRTFLQKEPLRKGAPLQMWLLRRGFFCKNLVPFSKKSPFAKGLKKSLWSKKELEPSGSRPRTCVSNRRCFPNLCSNQLGYDRTQLHVTVANQVFSGLCILPVFRILERHNLESLLKLF